MNDYHIVFTPRARSDILDIGIYIAHTLSEKDISRKFMQGLRNSISQLSYFPYRFPLIQDRIFGSNNVHCMPYKNYYVFYEIDKADTTVIILRIGYNKRDWKRDGVEPSLELSCVVTPLKQNVPPALRLPCPCKTRAGFYLSFSPYTDLGRRLCKVSQNPPPPVGR